MWTDPAAASLREDVGHRVLGVCRLQRRGGVAVQLMQLGERLADRKDNKSSPAWGLYWAAMEAVRQRVGAFVVVRLSLRGFCFWV